MNRLPALIAAIAAVLLLLPAFAQSPARTGIGIIISDLEQRQKTDEARAARDRFLFLQQQQATALSKLVAIQSSGCAGSGTENSTLDAVIAADRTFAMQQQVKAQQETVAATRALYQAIEETSAVPNVEHSRMFEMTETTYKATGLASLSKQQTAELDAWFKTNKLGIRIVKDAKYGIIRPDQPQ